MAPRVGSKKKPQALRTRSDSRVTEDVHCCLLIDLESGEFEEGCNPRDIVESKLWLYGDPSAGKGTDEAKLAKAVIDRIGNLRKLKKDDIAEYW